MKSVILALLFSFFFCMDTMFAEATPVDKDTVEVIHKFKKLYRYQNFYLSGQPSYEALLWLKDKGVGSIINLRSEEENEDFAESSFNEEAVAKQMGFSYHSIPVNGYKDYSPAKLNKMVELISDDKPVLIHCAGAGRVTYFFMAYLIQYKDYTVDEAIGIGKELTYSFPLENLLDAKITMEVVKDRN